MKPYLFWVEFYTKHLQLEMTIMYEVKKGVKNYSVQTVLSS